MSGLSGQTAQVITASAAQMAASILIHPEDNQDIRHTPYPIIVKFNIFVGTIEKADAQSMFPALASFSTQMKKIISYPFPSQPFPASYIDAVIPWVVEVAQLYFILSMRPNVPSQEFVSELKRILTNTYCIKFPDVPYIKNTDIIASKYGEFVSGIQIDEHFYTVDSREKFKAIFLKMLNSETIHASLPNFPQVKTSLDQVKEGMGGFNTVKPGSKQVFNDAKMEIKERELEDLPWPDQVNIQSVKDFLNTDSSIVYKWNAYFLFLTKVTGDFVEDLSALKNAKGSELTVVELFDVMIRGVLDPKKTGLDLSDVIEDFPGLRDKFFNIVRQLKNYGNSHVKLQNAFGVYQKWKNNIKGQTEIKAWLAKNYPAWSKMFDDLMKLMNTIEKLSQTPEYKTDTQPGDIRTLSEIVIAIKVIKKRLLFIDPVQQDIFVNHTRDIYHNPKELFDIFNDYVDQVNVFIPANLLPRFEQYKKSLQAIRENLTCPDSAPGHEVSVPWIVETIIFYYHILAAPKFLESKFLINGIVAFFKDRLGIDLPVKANPNKPYNFVRGNFDKGNGLYADGIKFNNNGIVWQKVSDKQYLANRILDQVEQQLVSQRAIVLPRLASDIYDIYPQDIFIMVNEYCLENKYVFGVRPVLLPDRSKPIEKDALAIFVENMKAIIINARVLNSPKGALTWLVETIALYFAVRRTEGTFDIWGNTLANQLQIILQTQYGILLPKTIKFPFNETEIRSSIKWTADKEWKNVTFSDGSGGITYKGIDAIWAAVWHRMAKLLNKPLLMELPDQKEMEEKAQETLEEKSNQEPEEESLQRLEGEQLPINSPFAISPPGGLSNALEPSAPDGSPEGIPEIKIEAGELQPVASEKDLVEALKENVEGFNVAIQSFNPSSMQDIEKHRKAYDGYRSFYQDFNQQPASNVKDTLMSIEKTFVSIDALLIEAQQKIQQALKAKEMGSEKIVQVEMENEQPQRAITFRENIDDQKRPVSPSTPQHRANFFVTDKDDKTIGLTKQELKAIREKLYSGISRNAPPPAKEAWKTTINVSLSRLIILLAKISALVQSDQPNKTKSDKAIADYVAAQKEESIDKLKNGEISVQACIEQITEALRSSQILRLSESFAGAISRVANVSESMLIKEAAGEAESGGPKQAARSGSTPGNVK